jgi:transcriptional regulator of acetoin/glycerol metabolism
MTVYGLDPADASLPETLTETQLRAVCEAMEPLTRAAQGTLDRLFRAVGDTGCCVLLTNRDGVPVDRRGAVSDDETFHRWGLWPGAVWSEATEGTNGIGTCLAEGRALTIHRDQHFHTKNTGLSCTVAPIYDHQGRLAAALDVSSCRADLTEGFVGLIAAAVALGIAAAVAGMGGNIGGVFGTLSQRLAPTESSVAPQAPNVPQAPNAPLFRTPSRDRGNLVIID